MTYIFLDSVVIYTNFCQIEDLKFILERSDDIWHLPLANFVREISIPQTG